MAFVVKQLGRFIISVTVAMLLLSVLVGVIVPAIFEKANIYNVREDALPAETPVIKMRVIDTASDSTTVASAFERAKGANQDERLDATFWQGVNTDAIYIYKLKDGYYKPLPASEEFSGSEVSDWIFVFTSENAEGARYTVNVTLSLYDFVGA